MIVKSDKRSTCIFDWELAKSIHMVMQQALHAHFSVLVSFLEFGLLLVGSNSIENIKPVYSYHNLYVYI